MPVILVNLTQGAFEELQQFDQFKLLFEDPYKPVPIVFTKFYNMLNDIANKLREKGITKAGNKDEFEKQRIARATEIINNFAQGIRKTVKNSQFFIYNPRSPTEKPYNYRFLDGEDTVEVELLPENTADSIKLTDIQPIESFLINMVNTIVP